MDKLNFDMFQNSVYEYELRVCLIWNILKDKKYSDFDDLRNA